MLAIILALAAADSVVEAVLGASGISETPLALVAVQALLGAVGGVAAWGAWRGKRWGWAAALAYGVLAATMVIALGPLLELEPDARRGLWSGAAVMLAFGVLAAWYLRRATRGAPL